MAKGNFKVEILTTIKSGNYPFPDKCLRSTIKNDGGSRIFIFDGIELLPGQSFPIPDVTGMYLKDSVKVSIVEITGDFTNKTLVSFINLIEH